MSDIVERLLRCGHPMSTAGTRPFNPDGPEAAATITALRAERDADRYELKRLREALDWGQSERTAARAIARELGISVDASDEPDADRNLDMVCRILGALTANISAERDALKARMAEAERLLRPFVGKVPDWFALKDSDTLLLMPMAPHGWDGPMRAKVSDLRRVALFLSDIETKKATDGDMEG